MLTSWLKETLIEGLQFNAAGVGDTAFMSERLGRMTVRMLWVVLPFGLLAGAVGVAANVLVGGWNWTLKPLTPKFHMLNPLPGLMKLVSKDKLIEAAKGSALALILGTIGALYLKNHAETFTGVIALTLPAAIASAAQTMLAGLGMLVIALLIFAVIDVPLQKYLHAERLKMSHQEVKQEHKEVEGNMEIKAKIRARMREMANRRMLAAVPTADLVVMNPTHYAVALKYDEGKMGAPRVVAKGADLMAMRIRDTAKESKVPVLQAPVLARALYAHAEVDREIPAALFAAVAQVLAYVYQLRAALSGRVALPGALPELNVPAELDPHNKPGWQPADAE
jgi:flagellar biosynthetic protein FlhB